MIICCALRSSMQSAVRSSPYRLAFGQQMITDGTTYKLLRNLDLLEDRDKEFSREDSFDLLRRSAKEAMQVQHERNEKNYNLRSRQVSFVVGQEVYRRNFQQSNFSRGFNAKLAHNFVKARNCYYELEDPQGKVVGKYHAKDIK